MDKDKKVIRYYVQTWIPVFADGEVPDDDDAIYNEYEKALEDMEQRNFLQPENKYQIITIKVDKNE